MREWWVALGKREKRKVMHIHYHNVYIYVKGQVMREEKIRDFSNGK